MRLPSRAEVAYPLWVLKEGPPVGDYMEFGAVVLVVMSAIFCFRLLNVVVRRMEKGPRDAPKLREMEQRLAELEEWAEHQDAANRRRISEVEERVDFAERMLGQRERDQLPRGE